MRQVGYVVAVAEGVARVALGEHLECNKCGACLATMGKKRKEIKVKNGIGADVGDRVEVETAPGFTVAAAFLLYIFPIIAAGAGALAGYRLLPAAGLGETAGAGVTAAVFFGGSLLLLRHAEKVYFSRRMPNIVYVLDAGTREKGGPDSQTGT
jgi:sigma-E factor negative regulatory protein RseC